MFDPSQMGAGPAGPGAGGPPPTLSIPAQGGDSGQDADDPAEQKVKKDLQAWMASADDPGEHAFVAKLYQQVVQFIGKEHDETQNALGLNSVQKTIARRRGVSAPPGAGPGY